MPAKKLPVTDEERLSALSAILRQEEADEEHRVLSLSERYEMKNLLASFESAYTCAQQAVGDEAGAEKNYNTLFRNVQLYVSHFMQVLYLATVRNEVKPENLAFYGLQYAEDFTLPDLSTEEALLEWGQRLIKGEAERTANGGTAIYNPPLTKVKVHYDLFKEAAYSLNIYRQSLARLRESCADLRDKADGLIWTAWTKVEYACGPLPIEERNRIFRAYDIHFYHHSGEQLNVFG
jgi:hypothetical protein